ncbi:MAG: DUF4129 domain-containing protein [Pseudomonadota bacterium]
MTGWAVQLGRWAGVVALTMTVLAVTLLAGPSAAQLSADDLADPGPVNEAYGDAIWRDSLSDEVLYIGPNAEFSTEDVPDLELSEEPGAAPATPEEIRMQRWIWGAVFALILVALLVVIIMNGGGLTARFSTTDEKDRGEAPEDRRTGPLGVARDDSPIDQFLAKLGAMADRRQALILLVSRALEEAAGANQVRLGRAQTARDAVRALPQKWRHWDAMRGLVRQAELVHFGGRDLPEDRWRACLAAAGPILRGIK